MEDLIPIAPDAAEFEVALEEWKKTAIEAAEFSYQADTAFNLAYLAGPETDTGKPAAEHLRKAYAADRSSLDELQARRSEIAAQAARFRVEFLIKRAGRQ